MTRGFVYIATGDRHRRLASSSAKSAKREHPEIPITLYTDVEPNQDIFNSVELIENPKYSYEDTLLRPNMLAYDKTIF